MKYIKTEAIVLKRHNFAEAHRYITLFSNTHGKISAIAKGVRKLSSTKRSSLEVFNHVKIHLYESGNHYLITETKLINSFPAIKQNLYTTTQAFQLLEIIDALTGEMEAHPEVFYKSLDLLNSIDTNQSTKTHMLDTIKYMLNQLGFGYPEIESEDSLKQHIENVAERPLRSKSYLILDRPH